MITVRPLNDNVLVRKKKKSSEIFTKSGILLRGIEQDYDVMQVIFVNPTAWVFNKEKDKYELVANDCEVGQVVVVEKNFYHEYNVEMRERVENTIDIPQMEDENFTYHLTKDKDIYLKFDSWEDAEQFVVYGKLYRIAPPKPIKRIG